MKSFLKMAQLSRNNEDNLATKTRPLRVKVKRKLKRRLPSQNKHLTKVMPKVKNLTAKELDVDGEENPQMKAMKVIRSQRQTIPKNQRRSITTDNKIDLQEVRDAAVVTEINPETTTTMRSENREILNKDRDNQENPVNQESLENLEKIMVNVE